jgi:hypothetical protein
LVTLLVIGIAIGASALTVSSVSILRADYRRVNALDRELCTAPLFTNLLCMTG